DEGGGETDIVGDPAVERDAVGRVVVGRPCGDVGAPEAALPADRVRIAFAEGVAEQEEGPVADVHHRAEIGAGDRYGSGVVQRVRTGRLRDLGDAGDALEHERRVRVRIDVHARTGGAGRQRQGQDRGCRDGGPAGER